MRADMVTRRALLSAAGALALAGCRRGARAVPPVPAELRRRGRIAAEVSALAALYAGVIDRFPEARPALSRLAAEHAAHVDALLGPPAARRLLRRSSRETSSPPGSPTTVAPPAIPATEREARALLADAEAAASRHRGEQARSATPATARLLASIAACNAVHAELLRPAP